MMAVLLLTVLMFILSESASKDRVRANHGVIDLRDWDFGSEGTVRLDGEWEFYRNQLLTPDDFATASVGLSADAPSEAGKEIAKDIVQVPGSWNGYLFSGNPDKGIGYGTYRLNIELPTQSDGIYGVKTSNIRMSNRIYMNGLEIGSSGVPAALQSESVQDNVPFVGFTPVKGNSVELIVQVANYSYSTGGIIYSIAFGDQKSVLNSRELALFTDSLSVAGLLIPGIFGLLLYTLRKQEKGLLFLGLFCFACLMFMLVQGEKLITLIIPGIPYWLMLKIQPVSSTLVYYFLVRSVAETNPGVVHKYIVRLLTWCTGGFIFLAIVMPSLFISKWEVLILINGLVVVGYSIYLMLKGKRFDSITDLYWLLSAQSIFMMIIIYLLYVFGIWSGLHLITYEMIIFFITQSALFANRFTSSAKDVEKLSEKLLTLDGLKNEFMANTSHELRTPLHGMINIAESMLEGAVGPLNNDKQAQHLSMIITTGKQLTVIINDILEFAELRNGIPKLEKRAVYIQPVVHAVAEVMEHLLIDKKVRLVQRLPATLPLLNADEDRLRQILYNLLGNAIKATFHGEIVISAKEQDGFVTVEVADTGIGMSAERLSAIFQSRNGKTSGRVFNSSGLGLRITKQLVELGGGAIWAESVEGRGTSFFFTVPCAEGAEASIPLGIQEIAAAYLPEGSIPLKKSRPPEGHVELEFRVLIVDDDPVNLQVLLHLLSMERCEVVAVSSAVEALTEVMAQGLSYDLVITDWMMPNMSGIELCRRIRERFMLSELPVLLLTAKSKPEDIQIGFEAGANDYISKPVDAGELRARVRTLLELRRSVKLAVQSEMAFLQAQIKPHFLYNALNTIIAVCPVDPYKAMDLLIELSQFLRSSFDFHNRDKLTTIGRELELVKSYLTLEKARFEERLHIEFEVNCDLWVRIPPLTIQPIIENAVNHGVMKKEDGGTVKLSIAEEDGRIVVRVEDDGVGFSDQRLIEVLSDKGTGRVGLSNIHRRLLNLYGSGLVIGNRLEQGATVSFKVPVDSSKPVADAYTMESDSDESDTY
ncbi:ATP-binding protein [Cohnella sp. WQ 127256]|uniref:hybrid sensor histidine kinase/response regulator n=1 Tax=Cohnella sp. WQ 127256 TaxID=2938790 RepID=UPI002117C680|nr:ATP-binding protein [Cohnella sp. WQ 127256]